MEKKKSFAYVIDAVAGLIALLGVIVAVKMNIVGRSLWYDEAALAFSFSKRDLFSLTKEPLEVFQSAPAGWLYLLKLFTLLFGNTDFMLRVPSILFYIGILFLTYLLSRESFHSEYPLLPTAFTASLPLLLQYANVFKPYICDGFVALLSVWLYYLYENKKIRAGTLGIFWAILIWISNPVCFVEGGFLLIEGVEILWKKDWKKIKELVVICMFLLVSFAGDYFYWLRPAATSESMQGFWADYRFPFLIRSWEDLWQIRRMGGILFSQFYRLKWPIAILLALCLVYSLYKRNKMLLGIYASFLVAVFASSIRMFPVNKRLWLFFYPMAVLAVFAGTEQIVKDIGKAAKENIKRVAGTGIALIALCGCILNAGIRYYAKEENVYWPGYEYKAEYQYLCEQIKDEDVYVFSGAYPGFLYYNKYNDTRLEGHPNSVYIGYLPLGRYNDCENDMSYILGSERCYIFMSDTWDNIESTEVLFSQTHAAGFMEMVYYGHETPLWYFCKDASDAKTKVSVRIVREQNSGGEQRVTVELKNTGEAYLNPKFETLQLIEEETGRSYELPKMIEPGKTTEIEIEAGDVKTLRLHLQNEYRNMSETMELAL